MTTARRTTDPTAGAVLWQPPGLERLDESTVARTERVTPGMCGPNSLFAGSLGDWTWDAVSAVCGIDVYDARDRDGRPAYLSFSYFRIRAGHALHPLGLRFGDRLEVVSRVFGQGSESVLTLHRVRRPDGTAPRSIEPAAFYTGNDPASLYVENFNRWISRSRAHSNRGLTRASPPGFRHRHLPTVPRAHSPRLAYAHAREHGTLLDADPAGRTAVVAGFTVDYPVEASRDLNGVGLLYFATYFSILDWALLRLWRRLGRPGRDFLHRVLLDQRLCYLGNAEADATIRVSLTLWRADADPGDELVEATLHDTAEGTLLAVAALRMCGPPGAGS